MSQYSKQLISALEQLLNLRLKEFFDNSVAIYNFPEKEINLVIESVLEEYLQGETSQEEIKTATNLLLKTRRQKKGRWLKRFEEDFKKYELDSKDHPFADIINQKKILKVNQWKQLYGNKSLEDVMEQYSLDIHVWQQDKKSYLIDFPLIYNYTQKAIFMSFRQDLFLNISEIINQHFYGSIDYFLRKRPTVLINNPVFAPSSFNVLLQESVDGIFAGLLNNKEDGFQMTVSTKEKSENGKLKMLDVKDETILNCLFNHITKDFYNSKTVKIDIGSLAKMLHPRPSAKHYDDLTKRINNMLNIKFAYSDKSSKNSINFNLFDTVIIYEDKGTNRKVAEVTFGNMLYNAIIQKKMISVTSNNYEALDNNLSKLLYYNLQKERITLSSAKDTKDEDKRLVGQYDYSFFSRAVLFKQKQKAKNIPLIEASLQEFIEKKIAIESYILKNNVFTIYFYPLSNDERADLQLDDMAEEGDIIDISIKGEE